MLSILFSGAVDITYNKSFGQRRISAYHIDMALAKNNP